MGHSRRSLTTPLVWALIASAAAAAAAGAAFRADAATPQGAAAPEAPQAAQQPPAPVQQAPGARGPVAIRFEVNPLVECYFYLKFYSNDDKPNPALKLDFNSEVTAFNKAKQLMTDQAAWKWFEDRVVTGPDPAAIREAAKTLPGQIDNERNRTGINELVDAMESGFKKYDGPFWLERQKSVNRLLVSARKHYLISEDRITGTLMSKMGFAPIDAPIVVYAVVTAGRVPAWGKANGAYYTVVGTRYQSSSSFLETSLHESTHILDNMQSYEGHWLMKEVRQKLGPSAPPAAVDTFLHGLIAYNAGALVVRFVEHGYTPAGVTSPAYKDQYAPYLSTYQYIWEDYLDGKMSAGAIIAKLAEEFNAVQKLQEKQNQKPPEEKKPGATPAKEGQR